MQKLGLYIHIPWCRTRCIYCDFNTCIDSGDSLQLFYHTALLREIQESGVALGHPPLDTIFFGGGTPTTLAAEQLVELVEAVKKYFKLNPDAEITTEANPGTVSADYLRQLHRGGINRLSLGVQSFSDGELNFLSRLHNADTARRSAVQARAAGFNNLSLDLIFNLPQQTLEQWQLNLQRALVLEPDHFSIYSLIIEPGTPLHRQVAAGRVTHPDDDIAADMYAATIDILGQAGYTHYEISNWAKFGGEATWETPRLASAHNLIYWRNQPCLGIGAGAFGTINGMRWANVKRPQNYIARVAGGSGLGLAKNKKTLEKINRDTAIIEQMLLGLRLVQEGVGAADFETRFGESLSMRFAGAIESGLQRRLLEWIDSPAGVRLRLTQKGRFLANQAVVAFME